MKNNENGRSMVEMLGVLAIIGVLSAGGLAGYSKAMFKHKMNSTLDQITMLVTNIRTMYGTQDNYEGLDEAQAIQLGIVPAAMKNGSGALVSPFKGPVTIATSKASNATSAPENTAFVVTYSDLPSEACINLATAEWGTGAGSGFIGVKAVAEGNADASGAYVGTKFEDSRAEGVPYKVGDAITACGQKNTSSVSFKFY